MSRSDLCLQLRKEPTASVASRKQLRNALPFGELLFFNANCDCVASAMPSVTFVRRALAVGVPCTSGIVENINFRDGSSGEFALIRGSFRYSSTFQ